MSPNRAGEHFLRIEPVLQRDRNRVLSERRTHTAGDLHEARGFDGDDREIYAETGGVAHVFQDGRVDRDVPIRHLEGEPVRADRATVLAPRSERNGVSRSSEHGPVVSADRACAHDEDLHIEETIKAPEGEKPEAREAYAVLSLC
jgi:hypothetical protein